VTDQPGSDPAPADDHPRRGRHRAKPRRKGLLLALPALASLALVLMLNTVIGGPPANDTISPSPSSSEEVFQPDSVQGDRRFNSSDAPASSVSPRLPATSTPDARADTSPSATPLPQPAVPSPTSTAEKDLPPGHSGGSSGKGSKPATPPGKGHTQTPAPIPTGVAGLDEVAT
jgi:hypothetical protein